jgi:hypothetical protein
LKNVANASLNRLCESLYLYVATQCGQQRKIAVSAVKGDRLLACPLTVTDQRPVFITKGEDACLP